MTFLRDVADGRASAHDIDDYVNRWHANEPDTRGLELHEYLGMTWEEYCHWGSAGVLPAHPRRGRR